LTKYPHQKIFFRTLISRRQRFIPNLLLFGVMITHSENDGISVLFLHPHRKIPDWMQDYW
jgi:hypothetical protein